MIGWPRLLGGLRLQLLLPLLAGLILAQIVSFALFFNERGRAVRTALATEIAGRVSNTARLLEGAGRPYDMSILRSAESPFLRLSLTPKPFVFGQEGPGSDQILTNIRSELGNADRTIHILVSPLERPPSGMPEDTDAMPWMRGMHRRHHPRPAGAMRLVLSMHLADGTWLNARTLFHRPPLQAAWPSLVAMVLTGLAIVGIVLWATQRVARPMQALAEATDRFGRGGEDVPLPLSGPDEVRRVTQAFNAMQERIARHMRERSQMLAALGHDLRSPITALRLRAEMVDDDEMRERLSTSIEEMQSMVETSLDFARGIGGDEPSIEIDIRSLIEDIAGELRDSGADVDVELGVAALAVGRPVSLKRVFRNIIENAARYGERARISLSASEGTIIVIIDDDGPGLDEANLESVFEPFSRLESSRSRDTGGIGLGLTIARDIIGAHGGDITLENRDSGGLRARIILPKGRVG